MTLTRDSVLPPREPRVWRGHVVPRGLDSFFVAFHQDFDLLYPSIDAAIDEYVGNLRPKDKAAVAEFLRTILDGRYDKAALATLWPPTDVQFSKPAKVVRPIFEIILSKISG